LEKLRRKLMTTLQIPLMGAQSATQLQSNGYKNTSTALSELVDNSIQAEAKNVDINIIGFNEGGFLKIRDIVLFDDGLGMDKNIILTALQFQGGNNHNAKSGLGKFGMGLPSSSCSQTKHFEIYTWQTINNEKKIWFNYMDLDEIEKTNNPFLNPIESRSSIDDKVITKTCKGLPTAQSGTIVYWKDINRATWVQIKTLNYHLSATLGRKFRHYINDSTIKIKINVFEDNGHDISQNRQESFFVKPFDPMFLMSNTQTVDAEHGEQFGGITSKMHGDEIPLTFEENYRDSEGFTRKIDHKIRLRFSHVKEDVRKALPSPAGRTELGKLYRDRKDREKIGDYPIISILRANREIDHDDYGFLKLSTGTKYEMERWISVELYIDTAESDWLFDIDNRKQQAKLYKLVSEDRAYTFKEKIHSKLSELIHNNIEDMRKIVRLQNTTVIPEINDGIDLPDEIKGLKEVNDGNKTLGNNKISEEEKKELADWITKLFPELNDDKNKLEKTLEWCLKLPCRHYIMYTNLGDTDLYAFKRMGSDKTIIQININHSFYQNFIRPIEEDENEEAKNILRLMFSSLVSAEQKAVVGSQEKERMLRRIRSDMAVDLEDYVSSLLEA